MGSMTIPQLYTRGRFHLLTNLNAHGDMGQGLSSATAALFNADARNHIEWLDVG